jgi:recombination protein RecR
VLSFPPSMQKLIKELSKLPSIGEKSAARLAYHLVQNDKNLAKTLSEAMQAAVSTIKLCSRCYYFSEGDECTICLNQSRDSSVVCVVEKPMDLMAIERVGEFRGLFHVLHGLWAPLRGQGPENMKLAELIKRVKTESIKEVIIATSSTVEGDATALYVGKLLSELGIKTTRPAQGLPKGGELEYADDVTLSRAFSGRNVMNY